MYAHRVLRYGPPGQQTLMVSNAPGPDLSAPERMFIPTPPEGEDAVEYDKGDEPALFEVRPLTGPSTAP